MFTKALHWPLSSANMNSVHTFPPPRSILVLYFHLGLDLSNGLFPSGFPIKTSYAFLHHVCYMPCQVQPEPYDHPKNIWQEAIIMELSLCNFFQHLVTSSILVSNMLLRTLFSNFLGLCSSLNVGD
jgi:hypothetical protein